MNEHVLFEQTASIAKYEQINCLEMELEGRDRHTQAAHCAELIVQAVVTGVGSVKELRGLVKEATIADQEAKEQDAEYDGMLAHDSLRVALDRVKNNHRLTNEKVRYNVQKRFERNRLNGTLEPEHETIEVIH